MLFPILFLILLHILLPILSPILIPILFPMAYTTPYTNPYTTPTLLPTLPGGKNFLCDQNLELPLFLRPIFVKFFLSFNNLCAVRVYTWNGPVRDRPCDKLVAFQLSTHLF